MRITRPSQGLFTVTAAAALALAGAGCNVAGDALPTSGDAAQPTESSTIRQTDDAGNRLPFTTVFPDRWNMNNDGTTYEPCTAVTEPVLLQFKLAPNSVRDAAGANHQTIRGCNWNFADSESNSLTQVAGNGPSLQEYRAKNDPGFAFLPNVSIQGREVLRFRIAGEFQCTAAVQSGRAQVLTTVFMFKNTPPVDQLCEIPVNFLRATIDRIPR